MPKLWRLHRHDADRVHSLSRAASVPPVVAQLLVARGIDDASRAGEFLDCKLSALRDPTTLPGVPEATERLMSAVRDGRKIVVYGDYDVDGMTAVAILLQCL